MVAEGNGHAGLDAVKEANDKGYFGEDAADMGRPAEDRDVQTAPAGGSAANIGTPFEKDAEGNDEDGGSDAPPYTTTPN